jgi:hypothetical protein
MPEICATASLGDCIEEAIDRIVGECFNEPTEEQRRSCVRSALGDLFGCIAQVERRDAGGALGQGKRSPGRAALRLALPDKGAP